MFRQAKELDVDREMPLSLVTCDLSPRSRLEVRVALLFRLNDKVPWLNPNTLDP